MHMQKLSVRYKKTIRQISQQKFGLDILLGTHFHTPSPLTISGSAPDWHSESITVWHHHQPLNICNAMQSTHLKKMKMFYCVQRRSQECELGGASLPLLRSSLSLPLPSPFNGGITPGNFFLKLKVLIGEF